MINLTALNTTVVANAGAALIATSAGAIGKVIVDLAAGTPVSMLMIVAPFVGLAIGGALTYIGRPSKRLVPPENTP